MSQTPNPNDPYGTEPTGSVPPPQPTSHGQAPSGDVPAPTSDPLLHPHDPYASDPSARQQSAPSPADPSGPGPQAAGGYDQGAAYGGGPAHAAGQQTTSGPSAPPADLKGLYEGPLSGQPVSDSDTRMWSLFAHLSTIIGYLIGIGFLGWLGPLIIFLVYKDRDRYIRYNAAEALNAAIAVVILSVLLWIGIGIVGVVTLGIGFLLSPIAYIPAVVHGIFAIVGAVKSNQGAWWNYPVNLRLVS